MIPDVDVWALTDTALWERITWCARSQDMWARQMAAASNGERGPAYRHALAQWKEARGRIWRRWASMIAGSSCAATLPCPPANWMRDSWLGAGGPPGWPDTCAPWRRAGGHGGVCARNGSGRACMVRRSGASTHNPPSDRKPPHMLPAVGKSTWGGCSGTVRCAWCAGQGLYGWQCHNTISRWLGRNGSGLPGRMNSWSGWPCRSLHLSHRRWLTSPARERLRENNTTATSAPTGIRQ